MSLRDELVAEHCELAEFIADTVERNMMTSPAEQRRFIDGFINIMLTAAVKDGGPKSKWRLGFDGDTPVTQIEGY